MVRYGALFAPHRLAHDLSPSPPKGNADVKAVYDRQYDLNVSTYQMCILLCFNDTTQRSYQQIKEATNIQADPELRRHLISLCTPKYKILNKSSKGKQIQGRHFRIVSIFYKPMRLVCIADDDSFDVNADFKSKLRRVRIALGKFGLLASKNVILIARFWMQWHTRRQRAPASLRQ
jgi:hypothetical protein